MQEIQDFDNESLMNSSWEGMQKSISKMQGMRPQLLQEGQNKNAEQLISLCQRYGIAGLMFLTNFDILNKYYRIVLGSNRQRNNKKKIYSVPALIQQKFNYFLIYLQQADKQSKSIHDTIKHSPEFKQAIEQIKRKPINVKCKQSIELQKLFQQYFTILKLSPLQQKIKVKPFIQQKLRMTEEVKNCYCQSCFNWLKKSAEAMTKVDQKYLCCKIYYENLGDKFLEGTESEVQQFKNYYYPIQNEGIINHIQKTVVGFMNRNGGIIYMGLLEQKTKGVKVQGIKLQSKQKVAMRQFIQKKVLTNVLPECDLRQFAMSNNDRQFIKQYQSDPIYKQKAIEYYFNPYVSTDFTTIADPDTMVNIKDRYIMRIKVRPGDPFQFYSMIGIKQAAVTQYYARQDKSVKKKLLSEAKEEIYKRLKQKMDAIDDDRLQQQKYNKINSIKSYHDSCRFSLFPITLQQIKKQKQFGKKVAVQAKKSH